MSKSRHFSDERTTTSVPISTKLLVELRDHAANIETPMREIIDELVEWYLRGTGPWEEIRGYLERIAALESDLRMARSDIAALEASVAFWRGETDEPPGPATITITVATAKPAPDELDLPDIDEAGRP